MLKLAGLLWRTVMRAGRFVPSRFLGSVAALCLLISAHVVAAQPGVASAQTPVTAHQLSVSFEVERALHEEARRALLWRVSWTAVNSALAIGSVVAVGLLPRSEAPSLWVGSIASGVSALLTLAFPLAVEADADEIASLRGPPGSGTRRARLRELYLHAADDERSRVQWPWHVLNVVVALVPAMILWLGYQQPVSGLIQFGGGVLLGEGPLLTQPTRLADTPPPALGFRMQVGAHGGGIGCVHTF